MSIRYNERSWAIDVITEINLLCSRSGRAVRRAGGESTLRHEGGGVLFPDVLLFGADSRIVQGWELKMPDTPITDNELLSNAECKARFLGLNSFLVWNVTNAALHVLDPVTNRFNPVRHWDTAIRSRDEVMAHRREWRNLLESIVADVNDYFESGTIFGRSLHEVFDQNTIVDFILGNKIGVAELLRSTANTNATIRAEINNWWRLCKSEYLTDEVDQWNALAKVNLLHWMNKLLFAQWMKRFFTAARAIDRIVPGISIGDASDIISEITQQCDFLNIFQPMICNQVLTDSAWLELTELNSFLTDLRLENIEQDLLQNVLEKVVYSTRRELVGQYATPTLLADLLVNITVNDWNSNVLDPCCGTGTIAKAIFDNKRNYLENTESAISTTWSSDKFTFPLHIANIALAHPEAVGLPIRLFQADAIGLNPGRTIRIMNPADGSPIDIELPEFPCIVSNFPFVPFEKAKEANPNMYNVNKFLSQASDAELSLAAKSDLYAYLALKMWILLEAGGQLGIITSNSWLGTDWGRKYRSILKQFYKIKTVVVSGCGKWFNNADVVTTITVLEKRPAPCNPEDEETTVFAVLEESLQALVDDEIKHQIIDTLILRNPERNNILSVITRDHRNIEMLEALGLEWTALFVDLEWLSHVAPYLVNVSEYFDINRGERRGWDRMFYPASGHGIEAEYLRPVLKTPRSITGLIANPDAIAFCCSSSLDELISEGHQGALSWIRRFEQGVNGTGIPLVESLARSGYHWYEMRDDTTADLVAFMNYDERIFVARLRERSFVNQRLIRMTSRSMEVDTELCHALLNSILGIFYIEAMGFGRGLAALDLSASKLSSGLRMLNPDRINMEQRQQILQCFAPILTRPVLAVAEEINQADRIAFDRAVLDAYGLGAYYEDMKSAFCNLYRIRRTARR